MSDVKKVKANKSTVSQAIKNAWALALGPILELDELKDDPQARYFTSYDGKRIAVLERTDDLPLRTIAIFPATKDGKVAAGRVCDSLNITNGNIPIHESLSFEKL